MIPKAVIPSVGLLVQAILSFSLCTGRPHAQGHSHDGRVGHATENYPASAGSSLIFNSAVAAWGTHKTSLPLPTEGVGYPSSDPTVQFPFSDVAPSRQSNHTAPRTPAGRLGLGSYATSDCRILYQKESTTTSLLNLASSASPVTSVTDATVLTTAIAITYSVSTGTASYEDAGFAPPMGLAAPTYSVPNAFTTNLTPKFKARRAHADLHRKNFHRGSNLPSRLALRADDNEICPTRNGTTILSHDSKTYQIVCDIDFLDNDYPFQFVNSFEDCVDACDTFNAKEDPKKCVAALFVPSRLNGDDDCYLKSSTGHPMPANLRIEGAVLVKAAQSISTSVPSKSSKEPNPTAAPKGNKISDTAKSTTNPTSKPVNWGPNVKYAAGETFIPPVVGTTKLHGPTQNIPTEKYLDVKSPRVSPLNDDLLVVGVNSDITTHYGLSLDTGILEVNESSQAFLAPLKNTPHISRDGGQGGYLNGHHLFIFSDTGSYSTTTSTGDGDFLGFVSSSVAVDIGMNGLDSKALSLEDGMGEWSDDVGRMRGFAPLTQGEQSYNLAMQGKGQRYAIWPESSIIPLDGETALLYAPILYNNVNHDTKKAVFTYTGSTLLSVTAGGMGGPMAKRKVGKLFEQDEIEWGCSGGIRSWGPSGVGGTDGKVYVFGNVQGGILLSRASADSVADRDSYEYWDGDSWTPKMPDRSSEAFFITGSPFMDVDIFYSPRHLTFIAVYLTVYADSIFYYRYLKAGSAVLPSYAPGGKKSEDIVEKILQHEWSDEQTLFKAPTGLKGHYIYSGGVHQGYYGSDDISNGGSRMLLSWTAPTGLNPATLKSEYEIVTAEVNWE